MSRPQVLMKVRLPTNSFLMEVSGDTNSNYLGNSRILCLACYKIAKKSSVNKRDP